MSGEIEILTVAEDGGRLDRLTGVASIGNGNMTISIDEKSNIEISIKNHPNVPPMYKSTRVYLEKVNMEEFIHFLNEAKQFIDEQEVMNRLIGK